MSTQKRIEYIDAMRGFTMLLVVYSHVSVIGMGMQGTDVFSYNDLFTQFRMPLFFFVSGFVFYKATRIWNVEAIREFMQKKVSVQIISPLIFLALYCYCYNCNFIDSIMGENKGGYWFTFTLFEYYVMYILLSVITRPLRLSRCDDVLFLVVGLLVYIVSFRTVIHMLPIPEKVSATIGIIKLRYFIFFVLGTLLRKHNARWDSLFDNASILTTALLAYISVNIMLTSTGIVPSNIQRASYPLTMLIAGMAGVFMVMAFFRKNQASFTQDTAMGRIMQMVGRRTLDIYLLHYFFVSSRMNAVFPDFSKLNSPFMEFCCSIAVSVLVIVMCLIVSNVIRLSQPVSKRLFGN